MKRILKVFDYFFIGFSYLANKRVIVVLVMVMFTCLLLVNAKYKEEITLIEHKSIDYDKGNPNIDYYYEDEFGVHFDGSTAINEMFSCYQKVIDESDFSSELKKSIDDLNSFYNSNKGYFSFLYQDLYSGFTVAYNEEAPIFTASSIKAPAMIYLYELASKREVNLEEKLTYTSNFYSSGSGILKDKEVNTSYTVGELIEYAIIHSDNIAYSMLMNRFGRENILSFWSGLGTKHIFTLNTIWGITSAKDASIYMKELYRFSKDNKKYGSKLLEYFKDAEWKLITNKDGEFNTASKGGWSGDAIHDATIVFEENPYILVVMSNMGEGGYATLFKKTSEMVGMLHEEYWKLKVQMCNDIKMY